MELEAVAYAGFWRRWAASFLDGLITGVFGFIVGFAIGLAGATLKTDQTVISVVSSLLSVAVTWTYAVGMTAKYGQTWGKKWLHIKIVSVNDKSSTPSWGKLLLRETLGRFVSGIVLGLGYLWMIWDKNKQTWHDKMAGTVVIKV